MNRNETNITEHEQKPGKDNPLIKATTLRNATKNQETEWYLQMSLVDVEPHSGCHCLN
jgi:hypothetical protein